MDHKALKYSEKICHLIELTMNSSEYVRTWIWQLKLGLKYVLQQDKDPNDSSKSTTEWVLQWPNQSKTST